MDLLIFLFLCFLIIHQLSVHLHKVKFSWFKGLKKVSMPQSTSPVSFLICCLTHFVSTFHLISHHLKKYQTGLITSNSCSSRNEQMY